MALLSQHLLHGRPCSIRRGSRSVRYVGILGEEASLKTTGSTARVIEGGIVFIQAVRDAGIAADKIGDDVIRMYSANRSAIVFDDYKKEVVKYGN